MRKIGILTSGGDCPGLNAAISGLSKALFDIFGENNIDILGLKNGFLGFSQGEYIRIDGSKLPGLSLVGGTILGTRRTPYKYITDKDEYGSDKVTRMKKFYNDEGLDAVITLGGNGTHKTAALLSRMGLNIIALPKTIDNDIYGTDFSFGFMTAVDLAAEFTERVSTHAASHGRVMIVELMGNKAGWITLYSGLAAEADIILLPEFPYSERSVTAAVKRIFASGKKFVIMCVAEGAYPANEKNLSRKDRANILKQLRVTSQSERLATVIERETGAETRIASPGHYLRGGTPNAFDRIYSAQLGVKAATLYKNGTFGVTCAQVDGKITYNKLSDVAHKTKFVDGKTESYKTAKNIGVAFCDD
ncbi:MAG: ATP-dependent 6-phosphofructokinase [Oscillospiraceae bacterium]|jgi:6-phosphofructokinase 1|nr:ATP-dependent 6-phosphofructokinase [Oscillospiraceae bacterium]